MSPQDIRNLLGGYATGTLTEAEQQALYAAALKDEQLFAALADEQALRELLADPAARGQLLASLHKRPSWIWKFALISTAAAAVVLIGIATLRPTHHEYAGIARVSPPPPPPVMEAAPPAMQPKQAARKPNVTRQPRSAPAELSAPFPAGVAGGAPAGEPAPAMSVAAAPSNPNVALRYGLLKQGPGDQFRLQLETNDAGTLSISQGSSLIFTGSIPSHVLTVFPQEGALTAKDGPLRVVFQRHVLTKTLMRNKADASPPADDQISVDIKLR